MPPTEVAQRLGTDQLISLLCCLEAIDLKLHACPPEDRWHWKSRRNSALFLLNRLADSAAMAREGYVLEQIAPVERQAIAARHSLLTPLGVNR